MARISGRKGLEIRSRVGMRKPQAITGSSKAQILDLPEGERAWLYSLAQEVVIKEEVTPPGFQP